MPGDRRLSASSEKPRPSQEELTEDPPERGGEHVPQTHAGGEAPGRQSMVLTMVQSASAAEVSGALADDARGTDPGGSQDDDDDDDDDDDRQYLTGFKLIAACVALNLSIFLIFLDNSILSTATPRITDEFHSTQDIGWYVSSYQLALSALQPTTGKLFTYLSNKWTYVAALVIFELGSLVCALAGSSNMLIAGRTVAGAGASGLFNGALTIISALVPLQKRPALTGIMMGIGQFGIIGGPLIGGSLTQYTTWRWCFWINLPIGGLSILLLALVYIPEQRPKPPLAAFLRSPGLARRFDLAGAGLLVPSVVMLLLALHFGGGTRPWSSPPVVGLFCGAAAAAALFVAWERLGAGAADAMVPLPLLANRVVAAACLTSLFAFACTFVSAYFLPVYFQSVQGASPLASGVHVLPGILSQMLLAVVSGLAVSRLGYYLPWAVAGSALTAVGAGLVTTWSPATGAGRWIGFQVVLGAGRGAVMQMGLVAVQAVLPRSQIAVAMAVLVFAQGLGGAVLVSAANTIFDGSLVSEILARAPGVSPEVVLAAGATSFRDVVPPAELSGVLEAWAISFDRVFYLVLGLSTAAFFTSWGLGFHDVRKKQKQQKPQVVSQQEQDQVEKSDTVV